VSRITRSQLVADEAVWLLTMTYAGRTYRIATERVDVSSDSPLGAEVYAYDPGLTPLSTVAQALAGVSSAPSPRSVSLEIQWDDLGDAVPVAELVAQGHDLAAARAEVALWVAGTPYEDRVVVVDGRVREPEYGGRGEPVALTVEDEPWDDVARLVDGVASVTAWPDVHDDHEGADYPLVYGQPGYYESADGTASRTGGSHALCVDQTAKAANTLLIAGHHVSASQVYVIYNDDTTEAAVEDGPYTVVNTRDGLGFPVATIDVSTAGTALRNAGDWWISWSEGPALPSPYRAGRGITTLGEMMRWLADRSSVRVDAGAWAALAERLAWPIGGYVDDPDTTPLGYLQDALLPLAPVGLCAGDRGGLVPVLWRYDATAADAVDHLEAGPGVVRSGRIRYERAPRDVTQRITVQYAYDGHSSVYRRSLDLRPERDVDDPDSTTSVQTTASALRYVRPGEPERSQDLSAPEVWSRTTAARIAHWRIRRDGYSPRIVDYDVQADRAWIRPGAVVTLTDDDVALDRVVALVVERGLSDLGVYRLTLQILDPLLGGIQSEGPGANGPPTWVVESQG
jgi:hypothetical protein